ncbi:MAG: hypothetical protein ABIQ93_17245 [Saprospiraceae bacterium]
MDSLGLTVQPVQCNGLRNGLIQIDTVYGGMPPYYFSLDGQSFSTRPSFDHLWPGHYQLWVKDALGCAKQWPVIVTEPELLQVYLHASDTSVVAGVPFMLQAEIAPQYAELQHIEWRPPNLFSHFDTLTQKLFLSETTTFAIEIENESGCIARDQLTVEVEKTNLYFPNVIRPGSNQDAFFTVYAGEGVARIVVLQVYNRAGGLLFERSGFAPNDPLTGWNGRADGKVVQVGVYPWRAVVQYLDGHLQQFQGSVTVVN